MRARQTYPRRTEARVLREQVSELANQRPHPDHLTNGEEEVYHNPPPPGGDGRLNYIANYSKGLPHNFFGEVIPRAYRALTNALHTGNPTDFERIPLGLFFHRRLVNPQAGLAFDLEGPDAQAVTLPPPPRIDSAEAAGEMGELYWMALLRDVSFIDYGTGAGTDGGANNTAAAAVSLTGEFTDFRGPKGAGAVTPQTLFRGLTPGDLVGPYLSQFMFLGNAIKTGPGMVIGLNPDDGFISYGTQLIDQRQRTAEPGLDYLTTFPQWLAVQNGLDTIGQDSFDPNRRFIRNLRDLATYVHFDALYQAYLNACILLLGMPAPLDPGNPYIDSRTQDGFGTFGPPHILTLVTEVATRALKAVWFQKWRVHRRLRPEEFGGRIHVHRNIAARYPMIHGDILASAVVPLIEALPDGTALLPQAFPEGSPTHPAYGAGHATVAGACVTILKAWFDESFVIPDPLQPNADGTALVPAGPGLELTVGGELNKLAANISLGRNAAGVHWRTDYTESIRLGEEIAIRILQEQKLTYNEDHHLSLTRFDGTAITI
jgi:hypothetical protein